MKLLEQGLTALRLDEDQEGVLRMKFQFMNGGIPTGNGRVYPPQVLKNAVSSFNARLESGRSAYGSPGHKKELNVGDVSHQIERLDMDKDNNVFATVKVLPTENGKNLAAIIRNGGKLGVSARGLGSTKKNEKGIDEVGPDYRIEGVDFVLNPSTDNYVGEESIFESAEIAEEESEALLEKFRQACFAGFRGDLADYRKVFIEMRGKLQESVTSPVPLPGEEDDPEPPHDISEAVRSKLGSNYRVIEADQTEVLVFDLNRSEFKFGPWCRRADGSIEIGNLECI
jgi:hypothetical protein